METERLAKIVGKVNRGKIDRIPARLHYVETQEMLQGYLTRLDSRIAMGFYTEAILYLMDREFKVKEPNNLSNIIDSMSEYDLNVSVKKIVDKFFTGKFTYEDCLVGRNKFVCSSDKDTLFRCLYRVDNLLDSRATKALTIMEEQVYFLICYKSTKWEYDYIGPNTLWLSERGSREMRLKLPNSSVVQSMLNGTENRDYVNWKLLEERIEVQRTALHKFYHSPKKDRASTKLVNVV